MSVFGGLILTNEGRNLQIKAQTGVQLNYTKVSVGDGQLGSSSILDLTALKNKIMDLSITKLKMLPSGKAVIGTVLSNQNITTGFYFREIGIFATDPDLGEILYCYGNSGANAEYIPAGGGADIIEKSFDLNLIVGNATNITATIDSSLVYVTKPDFDAEVTEINQTLTEHDTRMGSLSNLNTKNKDNLIGAINENTAAINDLIYPLAGGTATALTVPMQTLVNGYAKTFIASSSNGGVTTTINGKSVYKPGTNIPPNISKDKPYTVWYNLPGDCFFLAASAEGDADVSNVLATKKFSNDNDTGLVGTMPNNGSVNTTLAINGTYTIPKGYHDGTGKVTQSITTKAATTYNPSTTVQTIAAGQYLNGAQTINPVTGNANTPQVLSGYTFASANGIGLTGAMATHEQEAALATGLNAVGTVYLKPAQGYWSGDANCWVYAYDANFVSANIPSGKSMFGLAGSATPSSLGGTFLYSGTITGVASSGPSNLITISGFNFTPRWAIIMTTTMYHYCTTYESTNHFFWACETNNSNASISTGGSVSNGSITFPIYGGFGTTYVWYYWIFG